MRPFNYFLAEVQTTIEFTDCGVLGICEGTALFVAQAGDAVFIPAESRTGGLDFEGTELIINNLPNHVVLLHKCEADTKKIG